MASRDFYLSLASRLRRCATHDEMADLLVQAQEWRKPAEPRHSTSSPARRRPKRDRPPTALVEGVAALNRLRDAIAARIHSQAQHEAAERGLTLAPARAIRKRRGRDEYALSHAYRRAVDILHEPAWTLPHLDAECGATLYRWTRRSGSTESNGDFPVPRFTLGYTSEHPGDPLPGSRGPSQRAPIVVRPTDKGFEILELHLGLVLLIGAMFHLSCWPEGAAAELPLLRQTALRAGPSKLVKLLEVLTKRPEWQRRVRRCEYDTGRSEGCYRFFIDRSPGRNADACSRSHAVRIAEGRRRRKRAPTARRTIP